MVVFVGTPPIKENSIMGCRGNHAFKHRQIKVFFPVDTFFGHAWGPSEQFDTHPWNLVLR